MRWALEVGGAGRLQKGAETRAIEAAEKGKQLKAGTGFW